MKKVLFVVLAVCFCLTAASCVSKGDVKDTGTSAPLPTVSADAAGIVSHGFVDETGFPANATLTEWYTEALPIETVPASLIYAKDGSDGLWHCWVYIGAQGEQDALTLRATVGEELCVILDYTDRENSGEDKLGAYYFTVRADAAPDFDLLINGEDEGMIVTHADASVAK